MASQISIESERPELLDRTTAIPPDVEALLPLQTDSISSLISWDHPRRIRLPFQQLPSPDTCIVTAPVRWITTDLLDSPIPSQEWLNDLRRQLEIRLSQAPPPTGLQHPTVDTLILPLWGITFWESALHAINQKAKWIKSQEWLATQAEEGMEINAVEELMTRAPWGTTIWPIVESDSPLTLLTDLLSTAWLRERHFDLFAKYFTTHTKENASEWWIGGTYLSILLKGFYDRRDRPARDSNDLADFRKNFIEKEYKHLIFPGNLNNNHWIAVHVDVTKRIFHYGDSADTSASDEDLKALRGGLSDWLTTVYNESFEDQGGSLVIGRQVDRYSCGICVLNAIEHAVLGVPLFTNSDRLRHRVRYFQVFLTYLLKEPSHPPPHETISPTVLFPPLPPWTTATQPPIPTKPGPHIPFFSKTVKAATTHRIGQAFQSLGFDGERTVVNKLWAQKLKKCKEPRKKILSDGAKTIIRREISSGTYKDRMKRLEPPYMAPSEDPDDYSNWCSFCNDFANVLVLCVSCRVGVCVKMDDTLVGCVAWHLSIESSHFVYECPWCVWGTPKSSSLRLTDVKRKVHKSKVLFRYDPPVLIVGLNWPDSPARFSSLLYMRLLMTYATNAENVMLLEVVLDGSDTGTVDYQPSAGRQNAAAAGKFLSSRKTAKIVVVIDTHCLEETGAFVWCGKTPTDYQACRLDRLLFDCVPKEVYRYLSSSDARIHHHPSLILNLSCGASVQKDESRARLNEGHCAIAVLSLSNTSTIVGDVALVLCQFATAWVQTPSDFDVLIANTIPADWAQVHRPVLSTGPDSHHLYTRLDITEPNGQLIWCSNDCGAENLYTSMSGTDVRVDCKGCNKYCLVPTVKTDSSSILTQRSLIKVKYPQPKARAHWKLKEDEDKKRARRRGKPSASLLQTSAPTTRTNTPSASPQPQPSPPTHLDAPPIEVRSTSLPSKRTRKPDPPVHLDAPPMEVRSTSLPSKRPRELDPPAPTPTPNPTPTPPIQSVALPALSAHPPPPPDRRLSIRITPMARSQSTPEIDKLSLSDYPSVTFSTSGNKRQRKK